MIIIILILIKYQHPFFHANFTYAHHAIRRRSWQVRRVALLLGLTPISTTVGARLFSLEGRNGLVGSTSQLLKRECYFRKSSFIGSMDDGMLKSTIHVGKYTSPMNSMGMGHQWEITFEIIRVIVPTSKPIPKVYRKFTWKCLKSRFGYWKHSFC